MNSSFTPIEQVSVYSEEQDSPIKVDDSVYHTAQNKQEPIDLPNANNQAEE